MCYYNTFDHKIKAGRQSYRKISSFINRSMGAAASVRSLYRDAIFWFRGYIDAKTYEKDFHEIDKDSDGGISFVEFKNWIDKRIKADVDGVGWSVFKSNMNVLKIAHKNSSKISDSGSSAFAAAVVDAEEFKMLLLHLFATSILWTHFDNADKWDESGNGNQHQLDIDQFRLACTTLAATHAQERLTDEQIQEDFELLDTNGNGYIGFIEVCNYCCRFIVEEMANQDADQVSIKARKLLGGSAVVGDLANDLASGHKQYFESHTADEISTNAASELKTILDREGSSIEDITRKLTEGVAVSVKASAEASDILTNDATAAITAASEMLTSDGTAAPAEE